MGSSFAPADAAGKTSGKMLAVALAGTIGTIIEWYDFLIYGTAAALIFNQLFFPRFDPLTGTLAALGSYAVGFVARPLGGAIFGHFGDRLGRRSTLILTLLTMGAGTFFIGLLPSYGQIGIFAPVLLVILRIIQGIGLGGEWGGASLMVIEHAPAHRRGFYGSLVQVGFPLGLVTSSGVFALMTMLPDPAFQAWGWRIPFLISLILVVIGLYVRSQIAETPPFEALKARGDIAESPFAEMILKPKSFLIALGLKLSEVSWVYMLTVFAVLYGTMQLHLPKRLLLDAIIWGALSECVTIPAFGLLSDFIGRRIFYLIGPILSAAIAFPLFWWLDTKNPGIVIVAVIVALNIGHALMFSLESTYFPELFGTRVRYSGASFGFQASAAIGGGFSPVIATALTGTMGGTTGVSVMLIILASITFIAALFAHETKDAALVG
jgi:MHS family shikimate/dehydroshikimate transporter-like MFS transporter